MPVTGSLLVLLVLSRVLQDVLATHTRSLCFLPGRFRGLGAGVRRAARGGARHGLRGHAASERRRHRRGRQLVGLLCGAGGRVTEGVIAFKLGGTEHMLILDVLTVHVMAVNVLGVNCSPRHCIVSKMFSALYIVSKSAQTDPNAQWSDTE